MGAVVQHKFTPSLRVVSDNDTKPTGLTDRQKEKQQALVIVMRYVRKLRAEKCGDSLSKAVALFEQLFASNSIPSTVTAAIRTLQSKAKHGTCPNRATLYRWDEKYRDYLNGNETAAAPKHQGSKRKHQGWEALALRIYSRPSKPTIAAVARELREDHKFETATDSAVRRYINSIDNHKGKNSAHRMGERLHRNTQKGFVRRDTEVLPVGSIYQGDGHTVDVYLAHPFTGKIWRAELTVWMDVRSRYIVGWYISESESSHSTLFALSHALVAHDHAPAMLHIDNGSGYASKMMNEASVGFYAKLDIETMFALPYNAKAKGQVERFFGTMERDFGKQWPTYCGKDMADEALKKIVVEVNRGNYQLPTLQEYKLALAAWIDKYHHRPHRGLDGKTPAELWATLERIPLHVSDDAIIRPRIKRVVQRSAVRLHNREYACPQLIAWNGDPVMVEYDLHNDEQVRILDSNGRWLCDAALVMKADYIPASRLEQAQQKRLDGQRKRLERKLDEVEQRSGVAITHADEIEDLELANTTATALEDKSDEGFVLDLGAGGATPEPRECGNEELHIDITTTDY